MRIGLSLLSILTLTTAITPVRSQVVEVPINNYEIPPGVETVPIGTLGHVERRGQGEIPMILLAGRGYGWRIWETFMQRNAERYTMYAITAAGYDGTAPPNVPEQLEAFENHDWTDGLVAGLVKLIEEEEIDHPIVVGHQKLGDHIVLRLGHEHSDLIRAVVVVAGDASWPFDPKTDGNPAPSVMDQILYVRNNIGPAYRGMNADQRIQHMIQLKDICNDATRAKELYSQQIQGPAYVDPRYFMEYLTTNLALELSSMKIPLLVVEPLIEFEDIFNQMLVKYESRYGKGSDWAKRQLEKRLSAQFGSMEKARESMGRDYTWDSLRPSMPNLRLVYVRNSKTFIMEDQPDKLDALIAEFSEGLAESPTTAPSDQEVAPSSASSKNP